MEQVKEDASTLAEALVSGREAPRRALRQPHEKFWSDTFADVRRLSDGRQAAADAVMRAVRDELKVGQTAVSATVGPACLSLILTGHFHLAEALMEEVLTKFPFSVRARLQLCKLLFWAGKLEAARDELAKLCGVGKAGPANPAFIQCMLAFRTWDLLRGARDAIASRASDDEAVNVLSRKIGILLELPRHTNAKSHCKTICINLDRDVHRYDGIWASYREIGVSITRRPGLFGQSIPGLVKRAVMPEAAPPNMVGCFMSHLSVWETVANGPDEMTLVLEDDGLPNFDFDLAALLDRLPANVDLCFLNDRVVPEWVKAPSEPYTTIPLHEAWSALPQETRALGADAYLLSRQGAEKLLEIVGKSQVPINTDWFMFAIGLNGQVPLGDGHADSVIKRTCAVVRKWPYMNARAAAVPLVGHQPLGFTARHHFGAASALHRTRE